MKLALVFTLLLILPSLSFAKDHEMQIEELGIGSVLVYRTDKGELSTTSLVGREGPNYVIEIREGDSGNGTLKNMTVVDRLGQRVRREADGVTYRYEPNFCYRTLGRCTFKFYNDGTGFSARVERFTEANGPQRFTFEMYMHTRSGSQKVEEGWYETGEFGAVTKYYYSGSSRSEGGSLVEIRRPNE